MIEAKQRSVLKDKSDVELAIRLIKHGARMNMLEQETSISYERMIKLYKEVAGKSPAKGQLPFSTEWFLVWQPQIHSSLFLNIYDGFVKSCDINEIDALIKAYEMYLEHTSRCNIKVVVLTITRAWLLIKFMENRMLERMKCNHCKGQFIADAYENKKGYVCCLCNPPARAGKTTQPEAHEC